MPGPCSMPKGNRAEWLELWEMVCDLHTDCTPDHPIYYDKHDTMVVNHIWVNRHDWLAKRNKLRTGKTL